jgi:quinol monooxygenase YgiN
MNKEVTCIANFTAKNGKTNELKQSLAALVDPTRSEEGCLSYTLHQNVENKNMFTMIEIFTNKESYDFHGKQPYLVNFKGIVEELVDSVSVGIYERK